jgi:hypothetical protein
MVNTTSKIKRKSDYNRTRLSRRIKKGGWPVNPSSSSNEKLFSVIDETEYLETYNLLRYEETYNLTDENINTGKFYTVDNSKRQDIEASIEELNNYKPRRYKAYEQLLKESLPVYPYARAQTRNDIASIAFEERIRIGLDNTYTYSNHDYEPVSIISTGYGPDYMLSH